MTELNVNCTGPKLSPDPGRRRVELRGDLDCDSPRVENDFRRDGRVYVEWVVSIDASSAGRWAPIRVPDDERMPADTFLDIHDCRRDKPSLDHRWTPTRNGANTLAPGEYRLR